MISEQLREVTKEAHQELEKVVVKKLKSIQSKEDYVDMLRYFYAYFNGVEQQIKPFITEEVLPDYKDRRNSSYLKQDIEALGGAVSELPEASIPPIRNTPEALGALYVMEGSIMGGRIIVQMLAKSGITEGVSFFSGYGESTGDKWAVFTAVLNTYSGDDKATTEILGSAGDTFTHFSKTFENPIQQN